jgi:hypothetical protein
MLLPEIPIKDFFFIFPSYGFGINNLKLISHIFICIMKGMLKEDPKKDVPYY